jgi:putative endopeptidase
MKLKTMALALTALAAVGATAQAEEHLKSVNPAYIDNNYAVGEDFYRHVNQGWMNAHPLTDEYARYGVFNLLADTAEAKVKEIVLNLGATNPAKGSNAFKIWTLYSQGMDSVRRNAEGAAPILDDLKKI